MNHSYYPASTLQNRAFTPRVITSSPLYCALTLPLSVGRALSSYDTYEKTTACCNYRSQKDKHTNEIPNQLIIRMWLKQHNVRLKRTDPTDRIKRWQCVWISNGIQMRRNWAGRETNGNRTGIQDKMVKQTSTKQQMNRCEMHTNQPRVSENS